MIQTHELTYTLRPDWIGLQVDIPYTFTNRTGRRVYLENCNGFTATHLERENHGEWAVAWSPVRNMCSSYPIVVEPNDTYTDTIGVWGAPPGSDAGPQFDVEDPSGTYRIVWSAAFFPFDPYLRSPGKKIPLKARTSNRFKLRR